MHPNGPVFAASRLPASPTIADAPADKPWPVAGAVGLQSACPPRHEKPDGPKGRFPARAAHAGPRDHDRRREDRTGVSGVFPSRAAPSARPVAVAWFGARNPGYACATRARAHHHHCHAHCASRASLADKPCVLRWPDLQRRPRRVARPGFFAAPSAMTREDVASSHRLPVSHAHPTSPATPRGVARPEPPRHPFRAPENTCTIPPRF